MSQDSLFAETVGPDGVSVRVKEETHGGSVVVLAAEDPDVSGYSYRENLGFKVRNSDGQIVPALKKKALKIAAERSNQRLTGETLADVQDEEDEEAAPDDPTLAEVFDRFRTEEKPELSEGRQKEIERSLVCWERYLGPNFPLIDFARSDWNRFTRDRRRGRIDHAGERVKNPDERREVSDATVRHDLGALRQVCRWAKDYRVGRRSFLLPFDPTRGCEMPSVPDSNREPYDDEEVEALLKVADQIRWGRPGEKQRAPFKEAFVIARDLGRRIGSILALRWSDWYPDEGTYGVLRWRAEEDKVSQESWTPVTPEVREALTAWRKEQMASGEASCWVFPAPRSEGHVMTEVAAKWLLEAEELAGVEHIKWRLWHGLRRRWATKRKGMSLKDVAKAGGWKTTQTLEQVYQQADPDTMEAVVMGGRPLRRRRPEE